MDSTAYPHILERVIRHCCSASTLLAFRPTSRRCQAVADDTLFHHVVLHTQCYRPAQKGRVRKLLKRITNRRLRLEPRLIFVLPASSPIDFDVPHLPFLPRKVHTLDVGTMAELGLDFFDTSLPWDELHAPHLLRRYGPTTSYSWAAVRDATVDFVIAKPPRYVGCSSGQEVVVPCSTPKYVLHLCWPGGWDPAMIDPDTDLERLISVHGVYLACRTQRPNVREATVVFSPDFASPSRATIGKVVMMATRVFIQSMVFDSATLPVVGLEVCLPDVDADEFRQTVRDAAIDLCVRWWEEAEGPRLDRDAVAREYDGIRFMTLEEWWEGLGSMKDVVGVWPAPRAGTGHRYHLPVPRSM
ncbi:uncharacterized protein LOC62_04G005274 [Vanrija pseudolonga]|uniref:F-box domain-containing protein n=1 Tax=Vanrija pseudolonga TaxID=143232 RepID=A0AAF0Y7Q6_9TREE|nr:hypothetical protein LOC62_04G005274 [Vanrija pseudolonga]